MKRKFWAYLLAIMYVVSFCYSYYIGQYETIYSLGVLVLFVIQGFGLILFLAHLLVTKYLTKAKVSPINSLKFTLLALLSVHTLLIVGHRIEKYHPTYTISIPDTFKGTVYLFITTEVRNDVKVNDNGIGYIGSKGKAKWRISRAGVDISQAYSTNQMVEIWLYEEDSTLLSAYDVQCFQINDSNTYPVGNSNYTVVPCMDADEFLQLTNKGLIDESLLRKTVWSRSDKESDWVADVQRCRL